MGGGYQNLAADFVAQLIPMLTSPMLEILVLPVGYATDPQHISEADRRANLETANQRLAEIEQACQDLAPEGIECKITLLPIFVRQDAEAFQPGQDQLESLTALYILGGDQETIMHVIGKTPVEEFLKRAYQKGAVIGGTSAGAAVLSRSQIVSYSDGFFAANSLDFGAVDLGDASKLGLSFGLSQAIIDQHLFQRGRLGRLINAVLNPGMPKIGIGIDAFTGAQITNEAVLHDVFGRYLAAVVDAETYHAADSVRYIGDRHILSIRNMLIHLLAPGDFSYDLDARESSLGKPAEKLIREFENLNLPPGAGKLFLSSKITQDLQQNLAFNRFLNTSGGQNAKILVVFSGISDTDRMQDFSEKLKQSLPGKPEFQTVSKETHAALVIDPSITGIVLVGDDQSRITPESLAPVKESWLGGIPLMTIDAGSAIAGKAFSAQQPTPGEEAENAEAESEGALILDGAKITPGLNLLDVVLEPNLLENNRWSKLFHLAYTNPDSPAYGLSENTAISLSETGPEVMGENVIIALDLRNSILDQGNNKAIVIANGLLDVFAPGERIKPEIADQKAAYIPIGTPENSSNSREPQQIQIIPATPTSSPPTPTFAPTAVPENPPTRTPRVTPISQEPPPPTDPRFLQSMILFGVLSVIVILIGVWLNSEKINLR